MRSWPPSCRLEFSLAVELNKQLILNHGAVVGVGWLVRRLALSLLLLAALELIDSVRHSGAAARMHKDARQNLPMWSQILEFGQ